MSDYKFRLEWKRLLSDKRPISNKNTIQKNSGNAAQVGRSEFERDIDRVVFSPAFRRLAKKTQVHPFAEIDHVHNRLTHSLEVASVGRSLAEIVGKLIEDKGEMPQNRNINDLKSIVQTACFSHDIGNPPFGHAGESAIREWTREHASTLFGTEMVDQYRGIARDWLFFEGNAQSFRLVSCADDRNTTYYRLTYAALGTMIKYPWSSQDQMTDEQKKCNVFSSEDVFFDELVNTLGLRNKNTNAIVRHPLSFLAEVADDICYRITDFEDAVQMKILSDREVRRIFQTILGVKEDSRPLSYLRAKTIEHLTRAAGVVFSENYETIMCGDRSVLDDLKSSFPRRERNGLKLIKDTYEKIFGDRRKIATELGAFNILGKILSVYSKTVKKLSQDKSCEKLNFVEQRCIALAWGMDYAEENKNASYEWWMSRVLDFVSGMTDNYATQVACEIEGIRV